MDSKQIAMAIVNYYGKDQQALYRFFGDLEDQDWYHHDGGPVQQIAIEVGDIMDELFPSTSQPWAIDADGHEYSN